MPDQDNVAQASRIHDPGHGPGTVIFVGTDYVGIRFDSGVEALIRRSHIEAAQPSTEAADESHPVLTSDQHTSEFWLLDTAETVHSMGNHWAPFAESVSEFLGQHLDTYLSDSVLWPESVPDEAAAESAPACWGWGAYLRYPGESPQVVLTLVSAPPEELKLSSLTPLFRSGPPVSVLLREVLVWPGGVEAQVSASVEEADICFYDPLFLTGRAYYRAGAMVSMVITGIAYSASPAASITLPYKPHPDMTAWQRLLAERDGLPPPETPTSLSMDGVAALWPLEGGDRHEYVYRGTVKQVEPLTGFLGQPAWVVRVTLLRLGGSDFDVDVLITRLVWRDTVAPCVGQDIEGKLWLQGSIAAAGHKAD